MERDEMRQLIVYYSYTGNNQILAEQLANRLNCEAVPILEVKSRTWLTTVLDLMLRRLPKIEPLRESLQKFDHVIFIGPIWANRIATPLLALFEKERSHILKYSFVTFCGGSKTDHRKLFQNALTKALGGAPEAVFELRVTDLLSRLQKKTVRLVSGYKVDADELAALENEISRMVKFFMAFSRQASRALPEVSV